MPILAKSCLDGAMTSLALNAVSKHYGEIPALDAVSLEFPERQLTAVIGPSGCGKSTLLKICNALEIPDTGSVSIFDSPLDYTSLPQLRRRIGYAVQGNGLFPHMTAGKNIALLAELEGWDSVRIAERLEELLHLSQLPQEILQRYPHQLSGGQQQRVGLCRAMMLRPELLLLDEPFAAIDPITRRDIHLQLRELQAAEPRTAVLVTHDMREALLLAQHIVVMRAGCIIHSGPTTELMGAAGDKDPENLLHELLGGAST